MSDVVNNPEKHRYELEVEGHLAATYYRLADGVITFVHTEVPPELGGTVVGTLNAVPGLRRVTGRGAQSEGRGSKR